MNKKENLKDFKKFMLTNNIIISPIRVNHCLESYGISIEFLDEKIKIVYSGDTCPCDNLIIKGKNADFLIHESTYLNFKLNKINYHSTTKGAIDVALKMNASNLILTHFSTNSLENFDFKYVCFDDLKKKDYFYNNTSFAFDYAHFDKYNITDSVQISKNIFNNLKKSKFY